jgi:arginine utilization protein RocB
VVLGLGSTPYLATQLSSPRVEAAVAGLVAEAEARHGVALRAVDYFAGISDMSFWGQGEAGLFGRLAGETPGLGGPAWGSMRGTSRRCRRSTWGPGGGDYHTPLERMEAEYGFRVLPAMLVDLCGRILEG